MTRYFTAPHRPRSWIADDVFEEPMPGNATDGFI